MKYLHLLWRNLLRRRIRTTFTFLSIVVAFLLFGLLTAIRYGFEAGVELAGQNRVLTIHKVSLIQPLPIRYLAAIESTPGVRAVTHFTWFGGIYQDPKNFFANMAVDPHSLLKLYPEYLLEEGERDRWFATRTGAIVGRKLAERFGWKVGDRIPLKSTFRRPTDGKSDTFEFDLVGIYRGSTADIDETQFFFHYDYLKERTGDQGEIGWYAIEVEDPERAEEVAQAIDRQFANSPAETKTATEKAFMQSFAKQIGDTGAMMAAISAVVFFVILLIAGNTMAQSVRERTAEFGVLKTIGFTDLAVTAMVLAESVLLTTFAGVLGLGLATLAATALGKMVEAFLPVFYVPMRSVLLGIALSVMLGLASGGLPAYLARRLTIVEALREALSMRWLVQTLAVSSVNLMSLRQRLGSSSVAVAGFAGVVAVFVAVLSIAEGFRKVMESGTSSGNALVLRAGSDTEMSSTLDLEQTRIIKDAAGVARAANGPVASAEVFVIVDVPKRSSGTGANVPMRGVEPTAFAVRPRVEIAEGRLFAEGRNEVIVGHAAAREFAGLDVGNTMRWGENVWEVVGIFRAEGSVYESEIWADARVLQPAYRRGNAFQSVYAKLESPDAFQRFKDALTSDPRLEVDVTREDDYYAAQSQALRDLVRTLGNAIAVLMAIGATFGALNTMYSAVAARGQEIATLRALGFQGGPVLVSVMAESLFLAVFGGVLGGAIAYLIADGYNTATMNFQSFSQVAFSLTVTPRLLVGGIAYALAMGFFGGIFPAIRAVRAPIALGLRGL